MLLCSVCMNRSERDFGNSHSCCLVVLYFNSVQSDQKKEAYHRRTQPEPDPLFPLRISPLCCLLLHIPPPLNIFLFFYPFTFFFFLLFSFVFLLVGEGKEKWWRWWNGWFLVISAEGLTEHNFPKGSWKMQCSQYSSSSAAIILLTPLVFLL